MALLRIIVTDPEGQTDFLDKVVDTDLAGSDAEELSDVEKALLVAAPEVCPWDCDYCRQE